MAYTSVAIGGLAVSSLMIGVSLIVLFLNKFKMMDAWFTFGIGLLLFLTFLFLYFNEKQKEEKFRN